MSQIALKIADAVTLKESEEECWFCKEEGESGKVTDTGADPDTLNSESDDEVPENDEKNDSSKLGVNIGNKLSWSIGCPERNIPTNVLSAAHHCIPGNASMQKAKNLLKFMKSSLSPVNISGDIGYSINHENNGVWLPGNYNVRKGKEGYEKNWGEYTGVLGVKFKNDYAKEAMNVSGVQFHDAHAEYSLNVLENLQNISRKLKPIEKCPICGEEYDKTRPPYGLVGRLDFLSRVHRLMITNLSKERGKDIVGSGYYTSSRVKKFFGI